MSLNRSLINARSSTNITGLAVNSTNVYHGPDESVYAKVGSIGPNETVNVLATSMGWYHIEYSVGTTSQRKTGYVPMSSLTNITGGTLTEEDFYGGYCYANTELSVRTCDVFENTAPVGTLFKYEGCTFLFSYTVNGKNIAFIEYATSSGTKRGYVYSQYLIFPCETIVCVARGKTPVYAGPSKETHAQLGTIYANELMAVISKEEDWIFVEYNTENGRKRGFVEWEKVNPRDYTTDIVFDDFYIIPEISSYHINDEDVAVPVYGGPSTAYAKIGAVKCENIINFKTNNNSFAPLTYIEYVVATTGLLKRGYIDPTMAHEGNLTMENNPLEEFSSDEYFTKIIYGKTQLERDMALLKAGTGNKHIYLVFAQHGWEDGKSESGKFQHGDGNMLLKIAKNFMARFNSMDEEKRNIILNNWTIYLFPGINLDGIANGYTNNGFGRCFYNGVDPNRSWPGNFKEFTTPRNKTGPNYLGADELVYLKNVLRGESSDADESILIDIHGWQNCVITNSQTLSNYYLPKLQELNSDCERRNLGVASGYLVTWAQNAPTLATTEKDMAGMGATTALLEFPDTKDYSETNIANYGEKLFIATTDLLLDKSTITPDTSKNAKLCAKLKELYKLAANWNDSSEVRENNKLVLDYLRHEKYSGGGTFYSEDDLQSEEFIQELIERIGGFPFDFVCASESKLFFYNYVHKNMVEDLNISELKVFVNALNKEIDIDHFAVTALTCMNRSNPYFKDLNGWAGDLVQLLGDCQAKYDSNNEMYNYTIEQLVKLIGYNSYDTSISGVLPKDAIVTGFNVDDLYQDIDAVNLAEELGVTPIYTVFSNYYDNGGDDNRIATFISKIINESTKITFPSDATNEDKIEYIARQYAAKEMSGRQKYLLIFFEKVFGDWNKDLWGIKGALAFRNKIINTSL